MIKERSHTAEFPLAQGGATGARPVAIHASPSETAEYVAQMAAELMTIAKSSADYIASMAVELSALARTAQLERLGVLLDAVRREAESGVL
ncbi:MAG TPA: hypothetical protein VFG05_00025 [Methylocella sp.]|nr:hypothetical protein [Methylocella sp.]